MPKVSIIMPVYNTGDVLRLAVDSILSQTFQDWELLLIDDGSIDCSPAICDEYSQKDSRIRVFHNVNRGICYSRNYGIKHANGDYVAFCDHDDEFSPDLLDVVVKEAEESGSDVVNYESQTIAHEQHNIRKSGLFATKKLRLTDIRPHLSHIFATESVICVWRCLYRREWLVATGELFDPNFKHGGEDINYNLRVFKYVRKFSYIPQVLYTHYIRSSLSTSWKMYEDLYDVSATELPLFNKLLETHNIRPELYAEDYCTFLALQVSFVVGYGIKLGVTRQKIIIRLQHIYDNNKFTGKVPRGSLICRILLMLLNLRAFGLLYLIGLVKVKFISICRATFLIR